jgi:hypothetical protein
MSPRISLAAITLIAIVLLNGLQATSAAAQCTLNWHDVLWPEESGCRPVQPITEPAAVVAPSTPTPTVSRIAVKRQSSDNDNGSNDNGSASNDNGAAPVVVLRPADQTVTQTGAVAVCEDGTLSYETLNALTCAGHGGVTVWLR